MRLITTILLLFLSFHCVLAQSIRGTITDEAGNPLSAVSIYINEAKHGTITNKDGEYNLKLPEGTYTMSISSIGYEGRTLSVSVPPQGIEQNISLESKDIPLQEIQVSQGEDRAYKIIRETIKKAPYYQSIIQSAVYENYSKASGKFTDTPKMMDMAMDNETKEELDMYKNRLFLQESLSEMRYTAPDKYEQTVKAYSSTMPFDNEAEDAIGVGMISLYSPSWGNIVSPLHPKSFSYYKFRYEGYEEDATGQIINIIRITPKLKDPKLITGIIHIADEEWSIRYMEYTTRSAFATIDYVFNMNPVIEDIYLVSNYENKIKSNLFGIKFEVNLLASIQYHDIQLNDSLLLIARNDKDYAPIKKKKEKKGLEIKDDDYKPAVDSLATARDSVYWDHIRAVVLDEEEKRSYQYSDTLKQKQDSLKNAAVNPTFFYSDLITGGRIGSDSSLMYFSYNGLLGGAMKEYNYADGLWLGQSFKFDFKKDKNKGLIIKPEIYWTSARKSIVWGLDLSFDYAPLYLGNLSLSAGKKSEDYAGASGMDRLSNSLISLLGGRNYAKFYDSEYIRLQNKIDITNGLQLTIGGQYAQSNTIDIHTSWNLFGIKDKSTPNLPDYPENLNNPYNRHAHLSAHIQYVPEYYYRIREGKKRYLHSRFPTFELDYRYGFSDGLIDNNSAYQRLELSVSQTFKLSFFDRFRYKVVAGKFFNNNDFNFIDYKHFNRTGPCFGFKSWFDSYNLLPYYAFSTNDYWLQAFVNYNTDYLLLKRLPFMQGKMVSENLHLKFLHTPVKEYYSELAYSVDLFQGIGQIGVFVGFNKFKYDGIGLQFSLPIVSSIKEERSITISF